MDDVYADLENYNDVHLIEQLQYENKELKLKLAEQSSKIDKIQKELDWVKSNHETMSMNFSSLLKTSRAEIERKTQLITNLNLEKDKWVLNFKNHNKNNFNIRRNIAQKEISNNYKLNNKDSTELKQQDSEIDRNGERSTISVDTISSVNTTETDKIAHIESKPAKLDAYSDQNSKSKENVSAVSSRPLSIKNRRKSMPVLSSDEEFEELYSAEDPRKKDWPGRRVFERNDKKGHKISETSGIDEKYSSHHESSKETCYKSKPTRHNDKHRGKETNQRHRRHFSPEKLHRKTARDHSDERYPRSDYGRHRVLESPPLGKYDFQRRNRERPSKYERAHDERPRFRREKYAFKHKIQHNYEEPSSKRFRSNSSNRREEEDKRSHKEKEFKIQAHAVSITEELGHTSCQSPDYIYTEIVSTQPIKEIMNTADTQLEDPRLTSKKYITKKKDNKVILSSVTGRNVDLKVIDTSEWDVQRVDVPEALQIPPKTIDEFVDEVYTRIDNTPSNLSMESGEIYSEQDTPQAHIVTESVFNYHEYEKYIRRTARSEKIVVNPVQTKVSINIDNPLDTSKYKIPKMKKPEDSASRSRDPVEMCREEIKLSDDCNKNHRQEDIKKNKSSDTDKSTSRVDVKNRIYCDNVNLHNKRDDKQGKTSIPHLLREERTLLVTEIVGNDDPKIKINEDSTSISRADPVSISCGEIKLSVEINKNPQEDIMRSKSGDTDKSTSRVDVKNHNNCNNVNLHNKRDDKQGTTSRAHPLRDKRTLSVREIVANDLELSDDNDDREMQEITKAKPVVKPQKKSHETEVKPKYLEQLEIGTELLPDDTKQHRIDKLSNKEVVEGLPSASNKKHKTKKSHKPKESTKKEPKVVDSKEVSDSKTILEKVKEITPAEYKVKFSDLFGESSSLITPEDLGLAGAQVQTQTNNYVPIFEDAQDAIDVNVEKLDALQTKSLNIEGSVAIVGDTCANNKIEDKQSETRKVNKLTIKLKKSNNHYEIEPENYVTAKEFVYSTNNIYNNINSEADTKETDVVKTMIISTGLQPQSLPENYVKPNTVQQEQDNPKTNVVTRTQAPLIQALATSTPYKENYEQLKSVQSNTRLTDASCNSNDSKREKDNVSSAIDQSSLVTNGFESQNNTEAPDVRIFVTRRKKRIRKAT